MRKNIITLCCLLFTSCYVYPPNLSLQQESSRIPQVPNAWKDEPIIILSDSIIITISTLNKKNIMNHKSISYVYVNKRNPTLLETMFFTEYVGLENTPVINASVMYPDGNFWKTSVTDFKTSPRYYSSIYKSDDLTHRFTFPRYVKGMVIRMEVTRLFTSPEHFWTEVIRDEYNILKKHLRFTCPKKYTINYLLSNNERLTLDTAHTEDTETYSFVINADTLKKIQENNRLKKPELWYAGLHVSVPPTTVRSFTWQELGDFYLNSVSPAMVSSQKIKDLATSLKHTQKDSVIAEAFRLVQHKIRYLADLEGPHSFIPRAAPKVLEKGYGDCKEMSTLLKVLLKEKGIETNLALVATEGTTQCLEAVPTLGSFNHIIVYYKNTDNTLQFYDPTISYGTAENSYFHLVGQKVLLLQQGKSTLSIIEQGSNYISEVSTRSKIKKSSATGKWCLEGTISLKGKAAYKLFPLLEDIKGEEMPPFLSDFLDETFNLKIISSTINTTSSDHIQLKYNAHFQSNYLAMDKGGFLLDAPSIFGGDPRYTTLDNEGPRFFADLKQHDEWEIPPGFKELEKTDLDHWIAKGKWSKMGNIVQRTYTINAVDVSYEKRNEIQDYYKKRKKFRKTTVWK